MRINYLDGLRGVAILLVLGFHAYSRWPLHVPYGNEYAMFPIFKLGWLGVQLFFLISGFVIFMTLDKTECFKVYIYKRWLRLFPAMLLASILIYLTAPFFNERPAGEPYILDLLPGLTFISPSWWSYIGINISELEGAFWSLYVEFKFYVIAGAIYYYLGRAYLVPTLVLLFFYSVFISAISSISDTSVINFAQEASHALSLKQFGWFAAGAAFYLYHQSKIEKWFIFALCISLLSSIFINNISFYPKLTIAALMISSLFAISLKSSLIQSILTNRILLFFGFISYPLYLIHENAMISMVIKFPELLPWLPMFFYPILSIIILSAVAYGISKKYEIVIRRKIEVGFSIILKLYKALQRTSR